MLVLGILYICIPFNNILNVISGAIIVTLRPSDVLYVAEHWWYFVENIY